MQSLIGHLEKIAQIGPDRPMIADPASSQAASPRYHATKTRFGHSATA